MIYLVFNQLMIGNGYAISLLKFCITLANANLLDNHFGITENQTH